MNCETWNESLMGRLYDEISPEDGAALDAHLAGCRACREALDAFRRLRGVLSADEPSLPRLPRVVVLRGRASWRPAAVAASLLAAVLLAGAGTGAGYALGQRHATPTSVGTAAVPAAAPGATPAALDPATEAMIRREIDRRWEVLAASRQDTSQAPGSNEPAAVSPAELRAELARFERKINASRATDLDYMLGEIQAAEFRNESRIGKTNQALRSVALASNGYVSAQ
jgi:hypothetical protein